MTAALVSFVEREISQATPRDCNVALYLCGTLKVRVRLRPCAG